MADMVQIQQPEITRQRQFVRFTSTQRFEHFVLLVCFAGLALTGMPQRYATEGWAQTLINLMGGIEGTRVIHRILATILMAEAIFHGGVITYKLFVLGHKASMIPGIRDISDVLRWIGFNLGIIKEHPHLPRYNFGEKAEYLAVVWGTLIMIITGFMLWNPIATSEILPGDVVPAAKVAHSAEALLAVLSIVTWHMYNVHFKRFNRSMFTGKLSREEMEEEHGEELQLIEQGKDRVQVPENIIAQRSRRFWPVAVVITLALVAGLIRFITLETTSITTIPKPHQVQIYAPQTLDVDGDARIGMAVWGTQRCGHCHGVFAKGGLHGPALKGSDISLEDFYVQVRGGSDDGEMPAFSAEEIPDGYVVHLWTWITQE